MTANVDTSGAACAVACMLVSNPQGTMRKDGDGWQKRVNDLIRALRDERDEAAKALEKIAGGHINSNFVMSAPPDWHSAFSQLQEIARAALAKATAP